MLAWEEKKAIEVAKSTELLEQRNDLDELIASFKDWIIALDKLEVQSDSDISQLPETILLKGKCGQIGLSDVGEALEILELQEGPILAGRWPLARLVGLARAEIFADALSNREIGTLQFWDFHSFGAWEAFFEQLGKRLRSDPAAQNGLWKQLDHIVTHPLKSAASYRKGALEQGINDFLIEPDIGEVWESRLESCVILDRAYLFVLASQINPAKYIEYLSRLPHPVLVQQCIDKKLGLGALHLLRDAPTAFGKNGTFLKEGTVVLSLLNSASEQCRYMAWGKESVTQPVTEEEISKLDDDLEKLRHYIHLLLEAFFTREDAQAIGWLWLERLIFEGKSRGMWSFRSHGQGMFIDPLALLINELSKKIDLRELTVPWIKEAGDLWRVNRLLAVLSVATENKTLNTEERVKLLQDLLIKVRPSFSASVDRIEQKGDVAGSIGAQYLLKIKDAEAVIEDLWSKVRRYREQAWNRDLDETPNGVAELVVLWALNALEFTEGERKKVIWCISQEMLEDAMQTEAYSFRRDFWSAALVRLCKSMKDVLTGSSEEDLEFLTEFLRPYAWPHNTFFQMVFAMQNHGIDQKMIEDAVSHWGSSLQELARHYLIIQNIRIDRGSLNPQWVKKMQLLAEYSYQ
ncbi:hypothetical protein GCM10007094_13140 [Pseudovibrio japonicus]|uniref:Uncharacterized protein n=1 Tax=Pseudovibrio japonicus TaxID=366534 RepID=A0ABQ3E636_9HYPH|nr:hypothetical protein [Pseudovibrio japonicus]GHB26305.1 hypothetical protein GCM10007094_13140 [Pseudovibrio japonicus]